MKPGLFYQGNEASHAAHETIRTDCYVLLAALLREAPSEDMTKLIASLAWDENLQSGLDGALTALRDSASTLPVTEMEREFFRLFIGLGSGEIIPYASWYREKMIQSSPLAAVRHDSKRLGLIRRGESCEVEDHAGALCEIMALLASAETAISLEEQAVFFRRHIDTWMHLLFEEMIEVSRASFYKALGRFGLSFLEGEKAYLGCVSPQLRSAKWTGTGRASARQRAGVQTNTDGRKL